MERRRIFVLVVLAALISGLAPPAGVAGGQASAAEQPPETATAETQPNFVLIVTDDQKWDTIGRCAPELDPFDFDAGSDACMPNLQSLLMDYGTTFLRGNVTQSLCCPSRASILTGQYTTTNGVMHNNGVLLDDSSTIATWLDGAGYRTGLFGKYLNGYGIGPLFEHIPPGWDAFETYHGFRNTDDPYTDYPWISWAAGDPAGVVSRIVDSDSTSGEACADGNLYSTDYICSIAIDFLQADTTTPFFIHVDPATPHVPLTIADRHAGVFSDINIPEYPSTNVLPSPNPPSYLPVNDINQRNLDRIEGARTDALEMMLGVDEVIGELHSLLTADGRIDNTVWVFISDNGVASGEHHWRNKGCEFYTCHQVPFVVACPPGICPGTTPGAVDAQNFVLNIDIAATLADLAGVTPTIGVEGESLVPILTDPGANWRDEWFMHGNDPAYEGIVGLGTDGDWYKYVELTDTLEFELYNLTVDQWELANLAGDAAYAAVEADLAGRLAVHLGNEPPPNVGPVAAFTWSCVDLDCVFVDGSSDADGTVVGWDWDFGDGGVSVEESPLYVFGVGGTYSVSLTVTDDDGATGVVVEDVSVTDPPPNVGPVAAFTWSCVDLDCVFVDGSSDADGTVVGWDWDFGDGGVSVEESPLYVFGVGGTYSVSLTVTDDDGATGVVVEDVTVTDPPPNVGPVAAFTWSCVDLDCVFVDGSSDADGTVVGWDWDFGDGGVSVEESPLYVFGVGGTYSVSLTVTDDDGATGVVVEDVTVTDPPPNVGPVAAFTWSCVDLDCVFVDGSSDADGTVVGWDWDFGDGGVSVEESPLYVFGVGGTYSVSLTVTDDDGATGVVVEDVTVTDPPPNVGPVAAFTWSCVDLDCVFVDGSSDADGTVVGWDWDFGDGGVSVEESPLYVFGVGGTYSVSLTVTDDDGATGVVVEDVTVTDPPPGGGPFVETDGMVVFEAEHYFENVTRSGDTWTEITDPAGFSGTAAMQALPDDGTRLRVDLQTDSPEVSFDVEFTATGTYYVWLRTWAPDVRGKAAFAGLDGVNASAGIAAGGSGAWSDGVGEWTWSNTGRTGVAVSLDVATAGLHAAQVWMGDDGIIVDKIVLTTDSSFVPVNLGPPESSGGPAAAAESTLAMGNMPSFR